MKRLIENFHKYLNEVEFGEEEAGTIKPDTPENTANFCKGKQNGTQVPQEIVYAINRDDKSKYVCYKETIMPAEQAYKHIAGVEKEAKPSVSPRSKAESWQQHKELLEELHVHQVFANPDAAEKFNDAMEKYKKKPFRWVCSKYGPDWVFKTNTKAGFKMPASDKCKNVATFQRDLWHKCTGDKCVPADPLRDCGAQCLAHKKKPKKKPTAADFKGEVLLSMPLLPRPDGKIALPYKFTKPFYIPPSKRRWQSTAGSYSKLRKIARNFEKSTGLRVFPAILAPGAGLDDAAANPHVEHNKAIGFFAAKSIVTRIKKERIKNLDANDRKQVKACGDDFDCIKHVVVQETKTTMPQGQVYKLILVRDDKEGIKFITTKKQDWPK
jgi:hypothetical protein